MQSDDDSPLLDSTDQVVHWQALEHIPQDRSVGWYVGFGGLTLLLIAVAVFLIKSWSFALVIAAAAAAMAVYIRRLPHELNYTLSSKGLHINDKLYPLSQYKAFGVHQDGGQFVLTLLPTKRFLPGLMAYFPENVGEKIVDLLSERLPMQKTEPDMVDRLVRKLRL